MSGAPLGRRELLMLALAAAAPGCARAPGSPPPPAPSPLHVSPLTDLAAAASLGWLVDIRPRALALDGRLAAALARVFPEERLVSFARSTGGVDLREADELVVASYPSTLLVLAHQFVDPRRIEAAFRARAVSIEGRAVEGDPGDPRGAITRLWGPIGALREQVAILGVEAVGLERGRFGPLRAAELFAQGKLKRASPALRAMPLSPLAEALGDAPLRAFASGPFEGELARGVGGLLAATTAAGASGRVVDGGPEQGAGLAIRAILQGAWGEQAPGAGDRLRAFVDVATSTGLGRLLGLAHCRAGPTVSASPSALTVDLTVDAASFADGLRAATGAQVSEIMTP